MKSYNTIVKEACAEYEEKKSRFITAVRPVSTEEEAVNYISCLKSKFWDATHNVYAYLIVEDTTMQRFSDDGEPSGTAGIPILEVIKKTQIQNVVVVVTRYFGGTLLGAGGLVRAYGKSAALGIAAAGIVRRELCRVIHVVCEYTHYGKINYIVIETGNFIKNVTYAQDVELDIYVPVEDAVGFLETLIEQTNARILAELTIMDYITVNLDGTICE